jgi:hypothetical protein
MKMKYYVAFNDNDRHVFIVTNEQAKENDCEIIGHFEMDINPETNQLLSGSLNGAPGEHKFITETKRLLTEYGVTDFSDITIEDKASHDPRVHSGYIPTTKEVEDENREKYNETHGKAVQEEDDPKTKLTKKPARKDGVTVKKTAGKAKTGPKTKAKAK